MTIAIILNVAVDEKDETENSPGRKKRLKTEFSLLLFFFLQNSEVHWTSFLETPLLWVCSSPLSCNKKPHPSNSSSGSGSNCHLPHPTAATRQSCWNCTSLWIMDPCYRALISLTAEPVSHQTSAFPLIGHAFDHKGGAIATSLAAFR